MSMIMTRNKRIGILVALLLFVVLMLLLLWWLRKEPVVVTPEPVVAQEEIPKAPSKPSAKEQITKEQQAARTQYSSVQSLSKTFTERYGSYSSEADFANLKDVLPLLTADFAAKVEAYIDAGQPQSGYYGISTKVVTITVDQMDETAGTAQTSVMTQREESKGGPQNAEVRYQEIVLTFVKEGDVWKVASATWQ